MNKKHIFLIFLVTFLSFGVTYAQSGKKRSKPKKSKKFKGSRGPKIKHHAGFFSSNDKATRKNEKFKKKNSKAGGSNKTSSKTASKSKTSSRTKYVKTFDHH